jgi:diguanylate cyclase (GGDEF)-like protein
LSLRARLGVAFMAALLGPVVLGAVGVAGTVQVGSRERVGERLERAAATVHATVAGQCQRLAAAAGAVALAGLPAAQGVIDRGLAAGVWVEDGDGRMVTTAGRTPLRPWADCAGLTDEAPGGWLYDAIVASAEMRTPDGQLLGRAYAVLVVDDGFLQWLGQTAGMSVGLLPARAMAAPPADPVAAAAMDLPDGGSAQAADGSLVRRVGPGPGQPLPLVLSARPTWPGPLLLPVLAVALLATGSGLALAWWLTHTVVRRHQEAQRLSITDPLTGLGNYRYLRECLRREVERASRFGRQLGVLALDLDRFKEVNDGYGHRAGDAVLAEFARRVRRVVREVDLVFRRGGEEFVILLPETDAGGCVTAANRLGVAVRDGAFAVDAAVGVRITVSIGIAVFPEHAATGAQVLDVADAALYAAKAAGRDTFVLASPVRSEATRAGVGGASGGLGARRSVQGG